MLRSNMLTSVLLGILIALLALPAASFADDDDDDDERRGSQSEQRGRDRDRDDNDDDNDDRRRAGTQQVTVWCAGVGAVSAAGWQRDQSGNIVVVSRDDGDDCDDDDDDRESYGIRVHNRSCEEGSVCIFVIRNRTPVAGTVNYTTANGTATGGTSCVAGVDYINTAGSVPVAPWSEVHVPVTTCVDGVAEQRERFLLNLTASGAPLLHTSARGRIRDPGVAVTGVASLSAGSISIGDATCMEGSVCTFPITQVGGVAASTVGYATANGNAVGWSSCTPGVDFIAVAAGSVAVGPNASVAISVQTCSDFMFDPNETFSVNLTSTTSGTIADGSGLGTIIGS